MKRFTTFATLFFLIVQPTSPKPLVTVGKVDEPTARANRTAIEAALLRAGSLKLPAGEIQLDQALQLGPQHSGGTLTGAGPATVLRNAYATGNGVNATLAIRGLGVPYIAGSTLTPENDALILDANVPGTPLPWDDPMAQTNLLRPGNVVYAFAYDSYMSQNPPPRKRFTIRSFDATTRRLVLDGAPDPALLSLKWMDGTPIQDVAEGDRTVRLVNPATAATFAPGRYVFVTDGPSLANGAVGEHRRVLSSTADGLVTLDQPVSRPYKLAALVRMEPAAGITVKNLTIGLAANGQSLCQIDATSDLTFDRVCFHAPADDGQALVGLNSCGRATFRDCTISGGLQLNATHDVLIDGGVVCTVAAEEGATKTTIRNAAIRLDPRRAGQGFNGVNWTVGADRLTLQRVRIEGYGGLITGGNGARQCPMIYAGRGLVLRDVTLAGNAVVGSYLSSDGGVIDRVTADGQLAITGGLKWRVKDSSAPAWELRAGSGGVITGCSPAPAAAAGWRITP